MYRNKIQLNFLTVIFLLITGIGCQTPRYMYSPSAQNVPLLTQKGDSKLSLTYATNFANKIEVWKGENSRANGFDIQSAIAISNHWAMQANYYYRSEQNGRKNINEEAVLIRYNRKMLEIAGGYFSSFNNNKATLFQVFAGIGKGNFSFNDIKNDSGSIQLINSHRTDVVKYWVQPAFIQQSSPQFSFSVTSRFSFINYTNIKSNYTNEQLRTYKLDKLHKGIFVFWEPAMSINFAAKKMPHVKAELQAGISQLIDNYFIDSRFFNLSIGLQADLVNILKAKSRKKE